MSEIITVGLDIAKHVFHAHGADERGRAVFSKRISRGKLLDFFAAQPSCTVALEACGGARHWARQLTQLGHEVRLIPPAYVKPFVKRQKNDAIDAEAICEAAQRPSMRFVAVKSEQQQAAGLIFRTRDLLVRQLLASATGEAAGFLRVLRTLRMLRTFRVLEHLRRDSALFRRHEEVLSALANLSVFIFVMTGVVYETQRHTNPHIANYADALYFTVTALTTTGFGDITLPGTMGRLITVAIMIFGVTLFLNLARVLFNPSKVRFKCPACGLQRHHPRRRCGVTREL
ncbi:IS110 family transposase [Tardiphaga robiniae]|uniref:IS110 family transposase n=1 Tax=Tardiphaga robiniae TaxID=943830 RepID=A0A7G6U892_9BRAD|nr:IS110 family transposase [Tardiphaga robiniae]